jgi:hypothetical protein
MVKDGVLRLLNDLIEKEKRAAEEHERVAEEHYRAASVLKAVQRIGARHNAGPNETVREIVSRAAEAGDEEALALLADRHVKL